MRLFRRASVEAASTKVVPLPPGTWAVRHRLEWDEDAIMWTIDDGAAGNSAVAPVPLAPDTKIGFVPTRRARR